MDEPLEKYRAHLIAAEQKAQEDFDKTLISLSGGALGVSFVFLKDLIGKGPIVYKGLLLSAWLCWGASVTSVLFSFFASNLSLRRAIAQVDAQKMYEEHVGGRYDSLTAVLNIISGVLFFAGVILIAIFVWENLGAVNVGQK